LLDDATYTPDDLDDSQVIEFSISRNYCTIKGPHSDFPPIKGRHFGFPRSNGPHFSRRFLAEILCKKPAKRGMPL
jgi:hypothetical protein